MRTVGADEAAALLRPDDSLQIALGPGQPPEFLEALGRRTDWQELRIYGALLSVLSDVFSHDGVHYVSGFYGPLERILRDSGANISFVPADFRGFIPLIEAIAARVVCTTAAPPDADGWCSLSLHSGATVDALHRAGADPDRVLIVETGQRYPRTHGYGDYRHAIHVDEIDVMIPTERDPFVLADAEPTEAERAIAQHIRRFIPDGATLQTGIGAVPTVVARLLADGDGGDYGIHSEMFTTGLMRLHEAGKVTNRKGQFDGVSVTTFAAGTAELYAWLDDNRDVAFLPVEVVNSPETIARNRMSVTINAALAVDIHGQAVADTVNGSQYSGIGGHEDFIAGPALTLDDRSILCMPSTYAKDGTTHSRVVPWFGPGAVITTPRHQVDIVVTEYGAAELQGKTVHQRGEALAAIAHPDFRDELLAAAERASGGRSPVG